MYIKLLFFTSFKSIKKQLIITVYRVAFQENTVDDLIEDYYCRSKMALFTHQELD